MILVYAENFPFTRPSYFFLTKILKSRSSLKTILEQGGVEEEEEDETLLLRDKNWDGMGSKTNIKIVPRVIRYIKHSR